MGDGFLQSVAASGGNKGSDAGANVDIVYAAVANKYHVISGIMWGFLAAPPADTYVKIYDGDGTDEAQVVFKLPVTSDGPGYPAKFDPHTRGTLGNAMVIRLLNASGDAGQLNCLGHYTQG
jgi:hypothetical protein